MSIVETFLLPRCHYHLKESIYSEVIFKISVGIFCRNWSNNSKFHRKSQKPRIVRQLSKIRDLKLFHNETYYKSIINYQNETLESNKSMKQNRWFKNKSIHIRTVFLKTGVTMQLHWSVSHRALPASTIQVPLSLSVHGINNSSTKLLSP